MTAAPTIATGAMAAGTHLFIVTLEQASEGIFQLKADQTAVYELQERTAAASRQCAELIEHFLRVSAIRRVSLRYSPDTGQYRPHPHTLKLETILQLAPGVCVDLVPGNSVMAWVRREAPELPCLPSPDLMRVARGTGVRAIEMAAFAAATIADEVRAHPDLVGQWQ